MRSDFHSMRETTARLNICVLRDTVVGHAALSLPFQYSRRSFVGKSLKPAKRSIAPDKRGAHLPQGHINGPVNRLHNVVDHKTLLLHESRHAIEIVCAFSEEYGFDYHAFGAPQRIDAALENVQFLAVHVNLDEKWTFERTAFTKVIHRKHGNTSDIPGVFLRIRAARNACIAGVRAD